MCACVRVCVCVCVRVCALLQQEQHTASHPVIEKQSKPLGGSLESDDTTINYNLL